MGPSAPPSVYSYNIPPGLDEKETNKDYTVSMSYVFYCEKLFIGEMYGKLQIIY